MTKAIDRAGQFGQILHFDLMRVRPGIRDLVLQADALVTEGEEAGLWEPIDGLTPQLVRSYLPDATELMAMTDIEVAEVVEQACLLALQSIHVGAWKDTTQITFFMRLQYVALGLAQRIATRSA